MLVDRFSTLNCMVYGTFDPSKWPTIFAELCTVTNIIKNSATGLCTYIRWRSEYLPYAYHPSPPPFKNMGLITCDISTLFYRISLSLQMSDNDQTWSRSRPGQLFMTVPFLQHFHFRFRLHGRKYICLCPRFFVRGYVTITITITKFHSSANCSQKNHAVLQACRNIWVFSLDRNC